MLYIGYFGSWSGCSITKFLGNYEVLVCRVLKVESYLGESSAMKLLIKAGGLMRKGFFIPDYLFRKYKQSN